MTWKSIVIGGRLHALLRVDLARSSSAVMVDSCPPGKRRMRQTMAPSAASHLAVPVGLMMRARAVLGGAGILTTTLVAKSLAEKFAQTLTLTVTRVSPSSWMLGRMRKGRFTLSVTRYFMS